MQRELFEIYPWMNHPYVRPYISNFSLEEWHTLNDIGLGNLVADEDLEQTFIISFFTSLPMIKNNPQVRAMLATGDVTFADIAANQLNLVTSLTQQSNVANPTKVIDWMGSELSKYIERKVTSYKMMDDIVQALSNRDVRKILAGDADAIRELVYVPTKLEPYLGQDIRQQILRGQITINDLIELGNELSGKLVTRKLPTWLTDTTELKLLANEFSDEQLAELDNLLNNTIKNDSELKCSFLRTLTLSTTIDGVQQMQNCPDIQTFKRLINQNYKIFSRNLIAGSGAVARGVRDALDNDVLLQAATNSPAVTNSLIRKYLSSYKSVHVAIPESGAERDRVLETTLRNIANHGNFWDLIIILSDINDINSKNRSLGKTALHLAAEYANQHANNQLCYKVLLQHPGIDPEITDNSGHKAADYLNPPSSSFQPI